MISKGIRNICKDYTKIENYEEAVHDIDETWVCHHRLEISPWSKKCISRAQLQVWGMYFDQSPEALIFLTHAEHARLHNLAKADYKGRKPKKVKKTKEELSRTKSENTKEMWQRRKEEGWTFSDEALQKMSKAKKGRNPWNKGKETGPRSEETKKKISEKMKGGNSTSWKKGQTAWNKGMPGHTKGKKHYTNGIINIFAYECPAGFREGWIKKNG